MPDYGLPTVQLRINPRTGLPEITPLPVETAPTVDPVTGQATQTGIGQLMVPQTQPPYKNQQAQQIQALMNAGRPAPGMTPAPSVGAAATPSPPGAPSPSANLANNLAGLAPQQSPQANQQAVSQWDKALQTLTGPTKEALLLQMGLGLLGDRPAGTSSANAISQAGLSALAGHSARVAEDKKEKRLDRAETREERRMATDEAYRKDTIELKKEELGIQRANAAALQEYRKALAGKAAAGGADGKPAAAVQKLEYIARAEKARARELGKEISDAEAVLRARDKENMAAQSSRAEYIADQVTAVREFGQFSAETTAAVVDAAATEWELLQPLPEGVTEADITATMRAHGMSRQEVLERLRAQ